MKNKQVTRKPATTLGRGKQRQESTGQPFKNVAVFTDVHKLLKELADADDRTMARQLSVLIRREHQKVFVDG